MTDAELIERLRDWPYQGETMAGEAADRIEALVREKAAAYAQGYGDCEAEISLTEIGRTNKFLHGQIAKWKARAERLEVALREIESISVHSGGEVHGVTDLQWELAFVHAQDIASSALPDATADAATYGVGITQDGKRIAPQDFFAVRDVDGKP